MTDVAETLERDITQRASEFAPRRKQKTEQPTQQEPQALQPPKDDRPVQVPQILTPNALRIATQLDIMERERLTAIQERDQALARIEQFEATVAELRREKEAMEIRLEDSRTATELERNERIRLSDAMESIIQLAQTKLAMPDPK